MPDSLELRLGGTINGRRVTTRDLDYTEIDPLIEKILGAALIEAGIERVPPTGRVKAGQLRSLSPVHLALENVYSPEGNQSDFGAIYRFVVGQDAQEAIAKITSGLAGVGNIKVVPEAAEKVRSGINRAILRGLTVQLENGVTTPTFSKDNPPPELEVYQTRKYESEIAARIVRVGGANPTARVRLLGSRQDATLDLMGAKAARELGHHLYRDAILKGTGEWVINPDRFYAPTRLIKFNVVSYRLLPDTTMDSVIDDMINATGGIWDGIDPVSADLG